MCATALLSAERSRCPTRCGSVRSSSPTRARRLTSSCGQTSTATPSSTIVRRWFPTASPGRQVIPTPYGTFNTTPVAGAADRPHQLRQRPGAVHAEPAVEQDLRPWSEGRRRPPVRPAAWVARAVAAVAAAVDSARAAFPVAAAQAHSSSAGNQSQVQPDLQRQRAQPAEQRELRAAGRHSRLELVRDVESRWRGRRSRLAQPSVASICRCCSRSEAQLLHCGEDLRWFCAK